MHTCTQPTLLPCLLRFVCDTFNIQTLTSAYVACWLLCRRWENIRRDIRLYICTRVKAVCVCVCDIMIHSSFFQEKWYISELCSNGSMHMYIQLGCLNIQALLTPIALLVKKISINDAGNCLSTVAIQYWLSVPRLCNEHLKKML